ncbi:conserved hypothetical protein [Leishmania infantum JPCM5]|uniref:Uncharacterized protein n=2 Tax=Leishmania infantum TaxID=5671 RepID=A4HS01_LEIIN|nr:conserved hypothetical protein [Leishmania infantum JPCM5]CAC9440413.1 hypothetical_protein_-_conserved [Leishmania infantum]CAM65029.1 conserved hypothetical protein [Leishmania infantum JPCM5]SUZ38801.1 hypothetical_protein_-_conserved [Leishmania infantum]|eukprot:XP_001462843.1 conserved hypothetical protein [Leishmania infantum JPCM5]
MRSTELIVERGPLHHEAHSMANESPLNQPQEQFSLEPKLEKVTAPSCESSSDEAAYPKGNEEEERNETPRDPCKLTDVSTDHYAKDLDSEEEEAAAASLANKEPEEDAQDEAGGDGSHVGAVPAEVAKTTRPHGLHKAKKKHSNHAKEAKAAETVEKPAAPRKKKPMYKVNIDNVERHPPVPEGVNTPRSVALCKEHGVNPSELARYDRKHFKGAGVSDEVAELRYQSYEKRRCARMAQLKPAYKESIKYDLEDAVSVSAAKNKAQAAEEALARPAAAVQAAAPPPKLLDEEAEMQRQFEAQHQRLLEQERRKTVASGYNSDGRRRSPPRAGHFYGASVRSVGSSKSPGRHSMNTSVGARPTVDQPYSAAKIYSASIVESRPLTQSEVIMIDEINEREAHRIDTQERAFVIQENKQLMHVERELIRERLACVRVQKNAEDREKMQQKMHKRNEARQNVAAERRKKLEAERQARIQDSIAEKAVRCHAANPYASLMLRQMSGFSTRRTSSSFPSQGADVSASQEQSSEAE